MSESEVGRAAFSFSREVEDDAESGAEQSGVPELKQMPSTIRDKLDGIVTFRTFHHLTNASMEGFNNKIRWLVRQAYGFRDMEYFKLKIFQLPEISCVKSL